VALDSLTLAYGSVTAEVVPARGAIVTALTVGGADILFLDRSTLEDPTRNVRGGIPVLFPYAGKLVDERFLAAGTRMKQHGFGRDKPWEVRERRADALRLGLVQDDETRAQYPYEYDLEYAVRLLPRGLQVELLVHNRGSRALPVSPGWHPYFRCPAARKVEVGTDVPGLRPAEQFTDAREFDFGVEAPATGRARLVLPGLGPLRLSFSTLMRHLQLWSQPSRDFVCVEPFLGPNNTVNTDRRLDVPPGRAQDLWMRVEVDAGE
jgi:galactose mutarotase-like enzyme